MSNSIEIKKINIVDLDTDCVVNAANTGLWKGGGVCGAIFAAAGADELEAACNAIGHCDEGSAVITPGFNLKAKYIIHAVGPHWRGGKADEADKLRSAYQSAMMLVKEQNCHSVGFPLISSGIFGYPIMDAWSVATKAIADYFDENPDADIQVVFAVLDEGIIFAGKSAMSANGTSKYIARPAAGSSPKPVLGMAWDAINPEDYDEDEGALGFPKIERSSSNEVVELNEVPGFAGSFTAEGITYRSCDQYVMAKKALMFEDIKMYFEILAEETPERCRELGMKIRGCDDARWEACRAEIEANAKKAAR